MSKVLRNWAVLVPCVLMVLSLGPSVIAADDTPAATKPADGVTLDLKDIDVRSAIELLFRSTGKNFSIDPNVSGKISAVSFKDVSFDTALKNLTKSNGLVYRIDGDVYIISKRAETTERIATVPEPSYYPIPEEQTPTTKTTIIEKVPLNYASASEIIYLLQNGGEGRQYGGYGNGSGNGYGNSGGGYNNFGGYGNRNSYGRSSYGSNYGGYGSGYGNSYGNSYGNRNYSNNSYNNNYNNGYRGW